MARLEDLRIESPSAPEPRPQRRLLVVGAVVVLAGAAWAIHRANERSSATPPAVRVIRLGGAGGEGTFSAAGYLEVIPPGPIVLSARAEGPVRAIAIEGDLVSKGDVLAEIDDAFQRHEVATRDADAAAAAASLARLEAGFRPEEIAQARAELARARAQAWLAETTLARQERLTDSAAQRDVDAARAQVQVARAEIDLRTAELELRERGFRQEDIDLARAEHARARAELERAKWRLDGCRVVAPFDGVVIDRFVRPGEWVSSQDHADRRAALVSLAPVGCVQAWVDVNQRDVARIHSGQSVSLVTDAQPDRPVSGRVARLLPRANLQKNTVQVKVQIDDPPPDFRPDLSVRVTFLGDAPSPTTPPEVVLPATALVDAPDGRAVLVVEGDRLAARRVETTSSDRPGHLRIVGGLHDGDRVILDPTGRSAGDTYASEETR